MMPQAQVYPPQVYPPQVYPPQVYPPQMPYVAPVSACAPQYSVPGVQYTPPSATVGPPSIAMGGAQGAAPRGMGGPQGAVPEKRNWVPLIIVLNVLFLLAVLVVVIFALKGK